MTLAERAEIKAGNYHYFICFGFPSGGCLWGVCIHAPLHVWVFRGFCEPGDAASSFHMSHQGVHSRNSCPVWESRRSQWGPGLGAPALGLHPASEWGQAQREVSYSVNSGFCFLLLFSQWCSGQGQPHRRQAMCKHSPASSSDSRHLSSLACIIMDLTPSVPIDTWPEQYSTAQPKTACRRDCLSIAFGKCLRVDSWEHRNSGPCAGTGSTHRDHPGHAGGFEGSNVTQQNVELVSSLADINIRPMPKWPSV